MIVEERLEHLAHQRAALSADLAAQRVQIAHAAQRLHRPLQKVDRLREDLHVLRTHYAWLLLPVALLAVLNPARTVKLAVGAITLGRAVLRAANPPPPLPPGNWQR